MTPDLMTVAWGAGWLVSLFLAYTAGVVAGQRRQRLEDLEDRFLDDDGGQ